MRRNLEKLRGYSPEVWLTRESLESIIPSHGPLPPSRHRVEKYSLLASGNVSRRIASIDSLRGRLRARVKAGRSQKGDRSEGKGAKGAQLPVRGIVSVNISFRRPSALNCLGKEKSLPRGLSNIFHAQMNMAKQIIQRKGHSKGICEATY